MLRLSPRVLRNVRCPVCAGGLKVTEDVFTCSGCDTSFVTSRGVPILIDESSSIFTAEAISKAVGTATKPKGLRRLLPVPSLHGQAKHNYADLRERLLGVTASPLVLSVGGGEGGRGQDRLVHPSVEIVTIDVAISDKTHLVADAHQLPFEDETFDSVVAQWVLEHVADPSRCVDEIYRVLKPTGIVYAETPFMQQVHMGRYDFTRYTAVGHRRLFRRFDQLAAGVALGPGTSLAWTLVYFLTSFSSSPRARKYLSAIGRLSFFWIRYFDLILKGDCAVDAASGFFFMGSKAERLLSDKEIVGTYYGGMSS